MVALLSLGEAAQVALEFLGAGPGGAIDALEHRSALVTPPVGAGHLLEGEVAEPAR